MKNSVKYFGVDVSKNTLHLAAKERFLKEFRNSSQGHEQLLKFLSSKNNPHLIMEASGGYERTVCEALQDAGITVSIVQPSCIRHFAKSIKVLAKTDQIDARVIAQFGDAIRPPATPKTRENVRKMRILTDRRQQVVEDRVRETNRMEACPDAEICQQIKAHIDCLGKLEEDLNNQIQDLIRNDQELNAKARVLMKQTGVGTHTTRTLLGHFPELGSLTRQQVAAMAGLAPHPRESGKWQGKRRIHGGRAAIRKALYMAAKSAARWCPVLSPFFQKLRDSGKAYNVAIIACARKLLVRLNTLMKPFQHTDSEPIPAITA